MGGTTSKRLSLNSYTRGPSLTDDLLCPDNVRGQRPERATRAPVRCTAKLDSGHHGIGIPGAWSRETSAHPHPGGNTAHSSQTSEHVRPHAPDSDERVISSTP